jgi:hypothetical protein
MHFGERLCTHVHVDPSLRAMQLPCMLLQPLVENAVVHGIEPLARPVTVRVNAWDMGDHALLEIADDGAGASDIVVRSLNEHQFAAVAKRKRAAVGMQSVIRRLQEVYGDGFKITAESAPGQGFSVRLILPLR